MQAFLALVPHLYQVNGNRVLLGESQVMYDKGWGYVLRNDPQTLRKASNFYRCHSCTIQQTGGKKKKGIGKKIHRYIVVLVFQSRIDVKMHVQVHLTIASTILLWRNFSCDGDKTNKGKAFFTAFFLIPVYPHWQKCFINFIIFSHITPLT